jgi:hypothetical protein
MARRSWRRRKGGGAGRAWCLILGVLAVAAFAAGPAGAAGYPRTANIYFPTIEGATDEELEKLSRFDVLVLNSGNYCWAPAELARLKSFDPETKILAHTPFSYHGWWDNPALHGEILEAVDEHNWWIRDPSGEIFTFPNGTGLLNITTNCPVNGDGLRLCDWLPDHLASYLSPGGEWDGVFLDCAFEVISWAVHQTGVPIDSDLDGEADDLEVLDQVWSDGTAIAVGRLRDLVGEGYLIVTNGTNTFWNDVNGSMLEAFPEQRGWYRSIADSATGYIAIDANYREPRYNIINVVWWGSSGEEGPHWSGYFIKRFLFTLASTLVFGDGYYSLNALTYDTDWWFPYYDLDLGVPLGPAEDAPASPGDAPGVEHADMIKARRYSQGVAVVNPTNVFQHVELPGAYYDPEAATAGFMPVSSVVTSVTMTYKMGRVLVGSGVIRPAAMGSVSAAFDGSGVDLWWHGPAWATRYAVYRRGVRGDGSTTAPELLSVVAATSFRDATVDPMRGYAYSVSPIDALDCEGWASDPVVVSTAPSVDPSVALMVEDPGGLLLITWGPPDVPGEMIFELERHDGKGHREWLGRFPVEGGEMVRYEDDAVTPGESYQYELFEVLAQGRRLVARASARARSRDGGETVLIGCRPHPISRWPASVSFRVGDDDNWDGEQPAALTLYDTRGRVVRRLVDGPLTPGERSIVWDGLDGSGRPVASGCYLYALEVGGEVHRGKAVVIR